MVLRMKRALPFLIITAVLFGSLYAAWRLSRSDLKSAGLVPGRPSQTKISSDSVKLGAEPPHARGNIDAPVMLEEFGDFECAPCGSLHSVLKSIESEFGADLVIVFRQFPIVATHRNAMTAARASEAAGLQGKFWEMHDILYENQNTWRRATEVQPIFEEYATSIGLVMDQFKRDISSEVVERRITLDRDRGYWIGVNSTPTVFLNGREVDPESLRADKLSNLIRTEMRTQRLK